METRRLWKDTRANVSFAFAAVFIMISITASSVISNQCEEAKDELEHAEMLASTTSDLERLISAEAKLAIQAAAIQLLNGSSTSIDFPSLQAGFERVVVGHFSSCYPTMVDRLLLNAKVRNLTLSLSPYEQAGKGNLTYPGGLIVFVEIAANATSEDVRWEKQISISQEIQTSSPFLLNRLEHLQAASSIGGRLSRMVQNILSQLVQVRIFQGYAAPGYAGEKRVEDILTEGDVERAVNLAILIMETGDFGSASPESWSALLGHFDRNPNCDRTPIAKMLVQGDPFRLFQSLSQEDDSSVDLHQFALQILDSISDKMVISFLEYSEILTLLDINQDFWNFASNSWNSFKGWISGTDYALESGRDAGREIFERIGLHEAFWGHLFSDSIDIELDPIPTSIYIFDCSQRICPIYVGNSPSLIDVDEASILETDAWRTFGEMIAQETLSCGESIQALLMTFSMRLAEDVPSLRIGTDSFDDSTTIEAILDRVISEFQRLEFSGGQISPVCSVVNPMNRAYVLAKRFIDLYWDSIFPYNDSLLSAQNSLARSLANSACVENQAILPNDWRSEVSTVILNSLRSDSFQSWNSLLERAISQVRNESKREVISQLDMAIRTQSVSESQGSFSGWLADRIPQSLVKEALIKGANLLKTQYSNMSRELALDSRFAAEQMPAITLRRADNEDASTRGGDSFSILPEIVQSPAYLKGYSVSQYEDYIISNLDPTGRLCICICDPAFGISEKVRSTHYTGWNTSIVLPYETNWLVKVRGAFDLSVSDKAVPGKRLNDTLLIDFEIPITAISGWPIEDVDYQSSDTLIGDALKLLDEVKSCLWVYISPIVEIFKKAFDSLMDVLSELSRYIFDFVEKIGKLLFDFGNWIVQQCSDMVDKVRASPVWKYIELRIELLGKAETRFTYGPFTIIVTCSLPDLLYRKAKDIVRIIVVTGLEKMSVSIGFRIARLSNGLIDIIFNSTITCDFVKLLVRVDPVMAIREHLFDLDIFWSGMHFELWSPEINDFRKIAVQLSDIPILAPIISNIPVPELGISISINAGFILKYRLPICDSIAINEVELNPPNSDSGREWVELYNPTNEEISLEGYQIETTHGEIAILELDGAIPARDYKVFTFPSSSLDNGGGGSFGSGDSLLLRDNAGTPIDETPLISDTKNDRKTWHRQWDGAPRWEFNEPSKGRSNGNALLHTYPDLMTKLCVDALFNAVGEEMNNVSFSLDFVKNLITSFLRQLIIQTAEFAATLVHEATLFLDVGINDLSGSIGGGIRVKVMVVGELIRYAILWFAEQLIKLLGGAIWHRSLSPDLLSGSHPMEYMLLGADIYFKAGPPKWLKVIINAVDIPSEFRIAASLSMNFATFGFLFGKDWGDYAINFGVHLPDLPGKDLINLFNIRRDHVDLWLMKGRLTPA